MTNTQTFNFICPACTRCRFIVSQSEASLSDLYADFTATYTTTLDTGATLVYTVTGRASTDNVSPVTQTIAVEPYTDDVYCKKAAGASRAAAAGAADANGAGVHTYPVGGKPLPMYRKVRGGRGVGGGDGGGGTTTHITFQGGTACVCILPFSTLPL